MPDMSWLKADLLDWGTTRGFPVDESMTKSQILAIITG